MESASSLCMIHLSVPQAPQWQGGNREWSHSAVQCSRWLRMGRKNIDEMRDHVQ